MIAAFISTFPLFSPSFSFSLFLSPLSTGLVTLYVHKSMQHCNKPQARYKADSQRATPSLFFSPAELFVSSTTKSYWLKLVMDLKWGPVGSLAAEMAVYWITGLIWFGARRVHQHAQSPQRERRSSPDFWTFWENTQVFHYTRLTLSKGWVFLLYIYI